MRKINDIGFELIKCFEGFGSVPYKCPAGYNTIGFGHVIKKGEKFSSITIEEAEELLRKDIEIAEDAVARYIRADISDNQFSSLVSFTFNLGSGALQRSTLRQKINYGSALEDICDEFLKWIYAGGVKMQGLLRRRHAESMVYYGG